MYVFAKAKSLHTSKWVFRGISTSPAHILPCYQMRLAARAFTCMLRLLHSEIHHNFQCTDITQATGWFHFVAKKGASSLLELDYEKQFDNIHPKAVLQSFTQTTQWLYQKFRWRQTHLQWSINCDTPKLDKARQATSSRFWHLMHDLLTCLLRFELLHNNVLQAVGTLWRGLTNIPMGGPFSAQSANLHILWKVKLANRELVQ